MSRWGEMDKKKIIYVLESGTDYLKDMIKTKEKEPNKLWNDYSNLKELLYDEGKEMLSITNQVKFEKKLNAIKKGIEKLEKEGM